MHVMLLLVVVCASSAALAWQSPQVAVEQYVRFDMNGGRLAANWKLYTAKYIYAPGPYDEPGWDMATIIKSWKLGKPTCALKRRCAVKVTFTLVGTRHLKDESIAPHDDGEQEILTFNVKKTRRGWYVVPDVEHPRISEAEYRKLRRR